MRAPLIAGNWKMNGTPSEARSLMEGLIDGLAEIPREVELLVIPPYPSLAEAGKALGRAEGRIALGAQNLHWEEKGAYTGEVSAPMLREVGCSHVLVGHSERRNYFAETGEILFAKVRAALRGRLVPILCIGERLEERESGRIAEVLDRQISETLLRLPMEQWCGVILAYEPVWAIGTGRTATPEQAVEAHRMIRSRIARDLGEGRSERIRILYGGSVNPSNAQRLLRGPGVDGALVGGSSLKAGEFLAIARAAANATGA